MCRQVSLTPFPPIHGRPSTKRGCVTRWADPFPPQLLLLDADLLEERLQRTFAAEELLNGFIRVAGIARLVDFDAQPAAGGLVVVAVGRLLEDRRHVRCNRICPRVTVIAGVVAHQVPEIGHEGRIRGNRQKHLAQNLV